MARNVLGYLKDNPHAITQPVEEAMARNPRCKWALELFYLKKGIIAPTIVKSEVDRTNQFDLKRVDQKNPEQIFQDSLMKATSLTRALLRGVNVKDINKLPIEDRLKLGVNFLDKVGRLVKRNPPNKQVFNVLNINSAKRADLEASFLKYAEQSMQDNEE
jgi:hypothetical protein